MAKQFFYSCVPAKMSLFNKTDGYDTFAHSEGITEEQIQNELSAVYNNKPTKEDLVLIRDNLLPPVYCQYIGADGSLVQSSISFIGSDYTGERSSYLVHSLILSEKEKEEHLKSFSAECLNKDAFVHDISGFNITSPDAKPDVCYPEKDIPVSKAGNPADIAENYDTGMIKRLIYALIGVSCGKIKGLYFSLPSPISEFSDNCLNFLNTIFEIFPYHMRENFSFVTYVGDISKFSSFKIKCISDDAPLIPVSKGISIRMGCKDYTGVKDESVAEYAEVVDFFYGLLTNAEMRREFIEFFDYAVKNIPELNKPTYKNIADYILLFRYLSGHFSEMAVLPNDDAVYGFAAIYEKNRTAIEDKYRNSAFMYLNRYLESHIAIPKNVFAKVTAMYPQENEVVRKSVMSVVLELIHTDVMREKLFAFVKANYDIEDAETKAKIMNSVCRVYYGGFLQEAILDFICEHFENEPADIRIMILEKLFLTIRTPKVQNAVLKFVDSYFDVFTEAEKEMFYKTFREMLPLADGLSGGMAGVLDNHIDDSVKSEITDFIIDCLKSDAATDRHKLCSALSGKCGYVESLVASLVFTDKQYSGSADTFLIALSKKKTAQRVNTAVEVLSTVPDLADDYRYRMFAAVSENFGKDSVLTPFDWVNIADTAVSLNGVSSGAMQFSEKLMNDLILPNLSASLPKLFDYKNYPDGIAKIVELAKDRSFISECEGFACVRAYIDTVSAVNSGNAEKALVFAEKITDKPARNGAAFLLQKETADAQTDEKTVLFAKLIIQFLKNDSLDFSESANSLKDFIIKNSDEENKSNFDELSEKTDEKVLLSVMNAGATILDTDVSEKMKSDILSENSCVSRYINSFISKYEKKGKKTVLALIEQVSAGQEYSEMLRGAISKKQSSGGFFKKLFK